MLPRLHILFSYAFVRGPALCKTAHALAEVSDVLVDSGAFTNFANAKAELDGREAKRQPVLLPDYIDWLKEHGPSWWKYIQLDVIADPKGTARNLATMRKAGLAPMPVLVSGENPSKMRGFMDFDPWVCVAGGVTGTKAYTGKRFTEAYEASGKKALIHGLGFVKWPRVFQLPIRSGDSTSWSAGSRWGNLQTFNDRDGLLTFRVAAKEPKNYLAALGQLRKLNVKVSDLTARSYQRGSESVTSICSIKAFLDFHAFADPRGYAMFFAITNHHQAMCLLAALSAYDEYGGWDYQQGKATFLRYQVLMKGTEGPGKQEFRKALQTTIQKVTEWKRKRL
jgi:hypothetical protein